MTLLSNSFADALVYRPQAAAASATSVDVIADTQTAIPGGEGNFTFMTFPTVGSVGAAFQGSGKTEQENIYLLSGGQLNVLVRVNAPFPDGLGAFKALGLPVAGDGWVVFWASGLLGGPGIYAARRTPDGGGELRTVADTRTAVPGGSGTFTSFSSSVGTSGNLVSFQGTDSAGVNGVFAGKIDNQSLALIANTNTAVPSGSGTFTSFTGPVVSGNQVAFFGNNLSGSVHQAGIYVAQVGGSPIRVADLTMGAPDGSGKFVAFTAPAIGGGLVAFTTLTAGGAGVFGGTGSGSLNTVASLQTTVPGGGGTFQNFDNSSPSVSGGRVAFWGFSNVAGQGIYASTGGKVVTVVDQTQTIVGQRVINYGYSVQQLSGGTVAFYALLGGGIFGNFTATVP